MPAKLVDAKLAIVTLFATGGAKASLDSITEEEAYRISVALGDALERKVVVDADLTAGTGTFTSVSSGRVLRFAVGPDGEWAHLPDAPEQLGMQGE